MKKASTPTHAAIGAEMFEVKRLSKEMKIRVARVQALVEVASKESVTENGTLEADQGRVQLMLDRLASTFHQYQNTHSVMSKILQRYHVLPTAQEISAIDTSIPQTRGGGGGGR